MKKQREHSNIRTFGLCDKNDIHDAHLIETGVIDMRKRMVMQSCPGQAVHCRNCDDRKCMGCVFREYDHTCAEDCPVCCSPNLSA